MLSLSASISKMAQNAMSEQLLCKNFLGRMPPGSHTCMLIVFHMMPFVVTLSKDLIHYYYMPQASKILSTGIASIYTYTFI